MTEKQKIEARLKATGRACDGCGNTIGRWTSKCLYVEELDRVFCSRGRCAAAVLTAPNCVICVTAILPGVHNTVEISGMGSVHSTCAASLGHADAYAGLNIVPHERVPDLSPRERAAIEEGPYVVVASRYDPGWFQIVRPLTDTHRQVRSTGNRLPTLFRRCAEFNG